MSTDHIKSSYKALIAMTPDSNRDDVVAVMQEIFGQVLIVERAAEACDLLQSDYSIRFVLCSGILPGIHNSKLSDLLLDYKKNNDLLYIITASTKCNRIDFSEEAESEADGCLILPLHSEVIKRLLKRVLKRVDQFASQRTALAVLTDHADKLEKINNLKTQNIIELQKNAIIGEMISGFIHNLKTPLMISSTSLEILRMQMSKVSPLEKTEESVCTALKTHLENICNANQRMNALLDLIMTKKRDDNNLARKPIDLNDFVRKEMAFLESDLEFKHKYKKIISLTQNYNRINVVYGEIAQILYNIINNAKEAMWQMETKAIIIATQADSDSAMLIIEDTGTGIRPEYLDKIFDPFFTTKPNKEEARNNEPTGTGLGLHSVKNLVKANDGEIFVESCYGEWTRFTVTFPLDKNGRV